MGRWPNLTAIARHPQIREGAHVGSQATGTRSRPILTDRQGTGRCLDVRRGRRLLDTNGVVHQYVDESIIGGLVLRVQDKLIDASVRFQLEQMRRQLLAATAK